MACPESSSRSIAVASVMNILARRDGGAPRRRSARRSRRGAGRPGRRPGSVPASRHVSEVDLTLPRDGEHRTHVCEHEFARTRIAVRGRRPAVDEEFSTLQRLELDGDTWLDHAADWPHGHDLVFDELLHAPPWRQRTVTMTSVGSRAAPRRWSTDGGDPEPLLILATMRQALSQRYDRSSTRSGSTATATRLRGMARRPAPVHRRQPHRGDRQRRGTPSVPPVHAGWPRPGIDLGHGDLFVMGGVPAPVGAQRAEGASYAQPRISISYRHEATAPSGRAERDLDCAAVANRPRAG